MRRVPLLAYAAIAASCCFVPAAVAAPPDVNSSKLRAAVTVDGIVAHQRDLQAIANRSPGFTRYSLTSGYRESVDYVQEKMLNAGWKVSVRQFNMPEWRENAPPVFRQLSPTAKTYVAGTAENNNSPSVDYITFEHSPTKEVVSAPVVPTNDIQIDPNPGGSTSGCEAEDYPAETAGAIALIQR